MKPVSNDNHKPKIIRHRSHNWVHDEHALDQGAYYLAEPGGNKFAVILPADRARRIDIPEKNARLYLRDFGSTEWQGHGPYTLMEALIKGGQHADGYRARWLLKDFYERVPATKERDPDFER